MPVVLTAWLTGCAMASPPTASAPSAAPAPISITFAFGKLAYVQNGNIWVKTSSDGSPRELTTDGASARYLAPRWSPSGEWLIAVQGDGLTLIRADGSVTRHIACASSPSWSPTQDQFVYFRSEDGAAARQM